MRLQQSRSGKDQCTKQAPGVRIPLLECAGLSALHLLSPLSTKTNCLPLWFVTLLHHGCCHNRRSMTVDKSIKGNIGSSLTTDFHANPTIREYS